jgi:hypothetical protein
MMPPDLTSPDSSLSLHDYEHTVTSMQPDGGTIVGFWTRVVGSPPSSSNYDAACPFHCANLKWIEETRWCSRSTGCYLYLERSLHLFFYGRGLGRLLFSFMLAE